MTIPKDVKIGGHQYEVVFEKLDVDQCGDTDRRTGKIRINKDLLVSEKEETFLHEVLHVINGELEEEQVEFLAQALYAFLKDNDMVK